MRNSYRNTSNTDRGDDFDVLKNNFNKISNNNLIANLNLKEMVYNIKEGSCQKKQFGLKNYFQQLTKRSISKNSYDVNIEETQKKSFGKFYFKIKKIQNIKF